LAKICIFSDIFSEAEIKKETLIKTNLYVHAVNNIYSFFP